MDGLDTQLAGLIDCALQNGDLGDAGTASSGNLEDLFAAVGEYLGQPLGIEARSVARTVKAFSGSISAASSPDATELARFRSAMLALRRELDIHREQQKSATQFADDPELAQEFLVESRQHLASIEAGLLKLEADTENKDALNAVFRSFHTIKGLAGFLGADAVQELAHETENVLDLARAGALLLSDEIIELILKSADELNRCLDRARELQLCQLPRCDAALLESLAAIAQPSPRGATADGERTISVDHGIRERPPESEQLPFGGLPPEGELPAPAGTAKVSEAAEIPEAGKVSEEPESLPARGLEVKTSDAKGGESSFVRIETSKLEYLIDMVGELVIAESVVRNDSAIKGSEDPLLSRNLTQLARVVQEVQKTSMSMRMVAIGSLFRKMSRLTRDLARKSGKMVELVTVGDDVELDRSIVEDLADPMVHMIRNAVDHGLEQPADRRAAGKAEKGTITLCAKHDAGDIVIELSDNGRGMDPAKILAKARRQGLVGEHDTPDEETTFRLIFEAGFSTAEKVTDLSGRGVGMDVVKKQMQKLRGRMAIRSVLRMGSTFILRLPLTLAIIDGLVVGVGAQRFILPVFTVREMFSPTPETFVTIENRAEAALFRNKLLPVIRLSRLFESAADDRKNGVLIVVEGRDQLYCIAVDQLIGKQEVVIKSLGNTFRDVPAISGGAILGDGRVGLIIDVNSLRYQE